MYIEEKNPLKQGLKLFYFTVNRAKLAIEEKNPLKQGLKQHKVVLKYQPFLLKRRIH